MILPVRHSILTILSIAILSKVFYYLMAVGVSIFSDQFPEMDLFKINNVGIPGALKIFKVHDAGWYEMIANNGHKRITPDMLVPNERNNWSESYYAFFPLYPLIVSLFMKLTQQDFIISGFIFSIIISFTCFVLYYHVAAELLKNRAAALWATILLISFPLHFYFSMLFSEALFLTLLLACFLSMNRKNWIVFAFCSILLVLTRPNGIFMLLPIFAYFIHIYGWSRSQFISLASKSVLYFLPPLLAFISYCIYLKYMTGDYFAFNTAQVGWGKKMTFPLLSLFSFGDWRHQFQSFYTVAFMAFSFPIFRRYPIAFFVLIWIGILLPLTAGSTISMGRYISVLFPFTFYMGELICNFRYRVLAALLLFALHAVSFYFFLMEDPFTY